MSIFDLFPFSKLQIVLKEMSKNGSLEQEMKLLNTEFKKYKASKGFKSWSASSCISSNPDIINREVPMRIALHMCYKRNFIKGSDFFRSLLKAIKKQRKQVKINKKQITQDNGRRKIFGNQKDDMQKAQSKPHVDLLKQCVKCKKEFNDTDMKCKRCGTVILRPTKCAYCGKNMTSTRMGHGYGIVCKNPLCMQIRLEKNKIEKSEKEESNKKVDYYENGTILTEQIFTSKGLLKIFRSYKPNGERNPEILFLDPKEGGLVVNSRGPHIKTDYYPNGKIQSEVMMKDAKPNGMYKRFYLNGEIEIEGNTINGKEEGEWKTYNQGGKLIKIINYKNGVEVSKKTPEI